MQCGQRCSSDSQVEAVSALFQIGRGQVDHDAAVAYIDPDLHEGAANTDTALANCGLGETYEIEVRNPSARFNLDTNRMGIEPYESGANGGGKHVFPWSEPYASKLTLKRLPFSVVPGGPDRTCHGLDSPSHPTW
jgi:hypothetical protein